jgi:hypothetical protein
MALQAEKRQEARHVLYVCLGELKIVWLTSCLVEEMALLQRENPP